MNYTFKPGDRVKIIKDIDKFYKLKGRYATVVYNDKMGGRQYAIDIDNFNYGHSCEGHVESDRGLWVAADEIELIDNPVVERLYTREEVEAEIAAVKAQMIEEIKNFLKNQNKVLTNDFKHDKI